MSTFQVSCKQPFKIPYEKRKHTLNTQRKENIHMTNSWTSLKRNTRLGSMVVLPQLHDDTNEKCYISDSLLPSDLNDCPFIHPCNATISSPFLPLHHFSILILQNHFLKDYRGNGASVNKKSVSFVIHFHFHKQEKIKTEVYTSIIQ